MLKKILPVGIGLVLIFVIVLTISLIKSGNDRMPSFDKADDTYVSYDGYNISYDRVYNQMKTTYASSMNSCYGLNELISIVDNKIFSAEVAAVDVTSNDYKDYILLSVLDITLDFDATESKKSTLDDLKDSWNDIVKSLRINNIITALEASNSKFEDSDDFTVSHVTSSLAFSKLLEEYKLSYAREEWAKKAYMSKYIADKGTSTDAPFILRIDDEDDDNYKETIEYYYDNNYSSNVTAIYVPFSSKQACLDAMASVGINTTSTVLSDYATNGWVKTSYNYMTTLAPAESDYMSYEEVLSAFIQLANKVYGYQGINLSLSNFDQVVMPIQTACNVATAYADALKALNVGKVLNLATENKITLDGKEAVLTWEVYSNDVSKVTIEDGKITINDSAYTSTSGSASVTVQFNISVEYDGETYKTSQNVTFYSNAETVDGVTTYTAKYDPATLSAIPNGVTSFKGYVGNDSLFAQENDNVIFKYDEDAVSNNSYLDSYICPEEVISKDATLYISNKPSEIAKSYTISPVSIGNYYALIMVVSTESRAEDLIEKDTNTILNQDIYDEIVKAKTEELYDSDNLTKMIYEERQNRGLVIYDRFIEAIYAYNYDYFFHTTLGDTDYEDYKTTKHNQKYNVAAVKKSNDQKKIEKDDYITAEQLFNVLEKKYASAAVSAIVRGIKLTTNANYNSIYNTVTNTVLNNDIYHALLTGEVNSFQKNFEAGYFTYSSLSSYFVPNFPAKYGWSNFIRDYFNCFSDQELLTSSQFGGSIYNLAYNLYANSVLTDADVLIDAIADVEEDFFDVTVVNLIVQIDRDYNSTTTDEEWTDELATAAKELAKLMFDKAVETGESTFYKQLNELVTLYNDAEYTETKYTGNDSIYDANYFGYYKSHYGFVLKVEDAAQYTNESSIVTEFADKCREIYNLPEFATSHGKDVDYPTFASNEAFYTTYGYHMTGITAMGELPNKDTDANMVALMKEYSIEILRKTAEESLESAKTSVETYAGTTYEAIYESQITYYTWLEAKYADMLGDREFTDEELTLINDWYYDSDEAGIKADLESSYKVISQFCKEMKSDTAKFDFKGNTTSSMFNEFLDLCIEEYDAE